MKILTLDIETAPNTAHVWGIWRQNIGLNQLLESGYVMCFAAKWHNQKRVEFYSIHHDGRMEMLEAAQRLMSEADAIVTWNGISFDIPTLNRELWLEGMLPPSPGKQIDLLRVVRRRFRFLSNKLQHISTEKGLGGKLKHAGHEMWMKCMLGDDAAWKKMARYNKQDVVLTEQLYDELLPWIDNHPHRGLYEGGDSDGCPGCGGSELRKEGFLYTSSGKYQRWQCKDCGTWSSSCRRISGTGTKGAR